MIDLDFSSGKITSVTTGALPDATAGRNKGVVHLTKGYISPDVVPAVKHDVCPLELIGEVDLQADTQADVDQILAGSWFFGFIQVARCKNQSASWEGRRRGEGSVDLFVAGFPFSNDIIGLDSDPVNQPFFDRAPHAGFARRQQPGQRRQVHVSTNIKDHPNYREFLVTVNSVTKSKNFLHRISFEVTFTSVFVGRDGNGPILPIAHINWKIDLQGTFKWSKGIARHIKRPSIFEVGNFTAGAPTDPMIKAIVDKPGPPLIKGIMIDRWRDANANPRMRQESAERSLLVPKDFYI
jgi:hypothetical protein